MGINSPAGQPRPPARRSPVALVQGLMIFLILFLVVFLVVILSTIPARQNSAVTATAALTPRNGSSAPSHVQNTATAHVSTLAPTSDLAQLLTVSPFPEIEGLFRFPDDVNPLTGLKVADPSRLERRPIMVKVSNFPRTGRPHAGLSFADLVYEYYIGYGLNRFAAIYLGQDCPQVGPIRSGRLVDAQLSELYQSLLVYGNADPTIDEVILKELGNRALAEKDLPTPPKYRIGPVAETNLFTNTAEVTDYVDRLGLISNDRRDLRGMVFSDLIDPNAKPATQLGVQFWTTTRGEWRYDAQKEQYLRWIEEPKGDTEIEMIPLIDRLTKEQLAFSNVVIVFATYTEYAPTKHDIALFNTTDAKRAIFFRDGVTTEGLWRTADNGHPIQFLTQWGAPYHLKPGNTWIVLAGDASTYAETQPGVWELRFDIP